MSKADGFPHVFDRLRSIMRPYGAKLTVVQDDPGHYSVNTPYSERFGKALWFGGVRTTKSYVSYHLMPVYMFPDLLDDLPPDLRRRMQGKSCFNFTSLEPGQVTQLARLTKASFARIEREKLL